MGRIVGENTLNYLKKPSGMKNRIIKETILLLLGVDGMPLEDVEKNKEKIKSDYKIRMEKAKMNQKGKNIIDVFKDVVNDDNQEDACLICDL